MSTTQKGKKGGRGASGVGGSLPIIIMAVIGVVVIAAVAIVTTRGGDGDETDLAGTVVTAPVTVSGTPLPKAASGAPDEAIGMAFPELSGTRVLGGSPITIDPADGRPKLIFYLAHWCPHCQREVPIIQQWLGERGNPEGVDLYAVSTSVQPTAGNYPPAKWLIDTGWTVPTMADSDSNDALNAAGVASFPTYIVVGADGTVLQRASGELEAAQLDELVAAATA